MVTFRQNIVHLIPALNATMSVEFHQRARASVCVWDDVDDDMLASFPTVRWTYHGGVVPGTRCAMVVKCKLTRETTPFLHELVRGFTDGTQGTTRCDR